MVTLAHDCRKRYLPGLSASFLLGAGAGRIEISKVEEVDLIYSNRPLLFEGADIALTQVCAYKKTFERVERKDTK